MRLEEFESVAKIASPVVALVLGPLVKRLMTAKPRVIRYIVHVSTHRQRLDDGQLAQVHAHAVTYENVGRSAAHNLRISYGGAAGERGDLSSCAVQAGTGARWAGR
jgi:hypothetical protein